ncbi:TetR/AcrR family transcriptional regulator [Frankia sp. CcI49]|uniref:TetR/AcrR family transcriptional regulator n=1 Tax=Frankia sp. CcI49 TaxID=1745382 RepID=UPI0009769393|nr:TetR/AcrR family transcriptional regulator [Frankia sp. CcI49]
MSQRGHRPLSAPRRTDARRNRTAILRAADEAFTDNSPRLVPLQEIAQRAGLGRATVYRYFPDRRAMAVAVAEEYFEALRHAVEAAEEEGRSFRDLLHWAATTMTSMRPLVALMRELPEHEQQRYFERWIGILTPALHRAQRDGEVRPDVTAADLALILISLDLAATASAQAPHIIAITGGAADTTSASRDDGQRDDGQRDDGQRDDEQHGAAMRKLVTVMLDGLFTQPNTEPNG